MIHAVTSIPAIGLRPAAPAAPGPSRSPAQLGRGRPRRRRAPRPLLAAAVVVSIAVVLPLCFLLLQAAQVGWANLHALLFRGLTAQLIWDTVSLTVVVTFLCAWWGPSPPGWSSAPICPDVTSGPCCWSSPSASLTSS